MMMNNSSTSLSQASALCLHGGLLIAELGHVAGHVKVLACLGAPWNTDFFYARGAYFASDAATTLISMLSMLPMAARLHPAFKASLSVPIAALVTGHQLQHAYYIRNWHKGPATYAQRHCQASVHPSHSPSVKSVVEWSSEWSQQGRRRRFGSGHWWKVAGTSFDIVTHVVMASAHVAWFILR